MSAIYITRNSDFFRACLKKGWAEGRPRNIKLPEEDPSKIAYYLDFIYTSKLPTEAYTAKQSQSTVVRVMLATLYNLGERMLDTRFRNAIINEFIRIDSFCKYLNLLIPNSEPSTTPPTGQILPPTLDFNADNTVTLLAGPDKVKSTVHGPYLARASKFFDTALEKEWLEGRTQVIELPEETLASVAYYLQYIYAQQLPTAGYTPPTFSNEHKSPAFVLLAELYVLGERRLDSTFRNAILQEMIRLEVLDAGTHAHPGTDAINIIYQGTLSLSPARRLMVDMSANSSAIKFVTRDSDPAFLYELAQALLARSSPAYSGLWMHREKYHV